jgi:phage terminase large subunit-like protein
VFDRFRTRGLEGKDIHSAWFEWSAPDGCDLDDPHAWAQANPSLGHRVSYENVVSERSVATDEGFARERLGQWSTTATQRVISVDSWDTVAVAAPNIGDASREAALAVDMAADRSSACVAAATWTRDDVAYVDVLEYRDGEPDWVVQKVAGVWAKHEIRAVVIDGMSGANSLIDPLRRAGITVTVTTGAQKSKACGGSYDAVMAGAVRHLNQRELNLALSVARKRRIGDGGFGWFRKDSESDISPLVAATLALWGLTSSEVAEKPRRRSGKATFV